MTREVDVCILGAGSAGLYATGQVARRARDFLVIDPGPLGTTCARVGCMPSKVLIQAADDLWHARHGFAKEGISGGEGVMADIPAVLAHVRKMRDGFAAGPAGKAEQLEKRGKLVRGAARFVAPDAVEVNGERIKAKAFVIATGSKPVVPAAWVEKFGEKILTTETLFEQQDLPATMAIIGMGVIGLEMGQALSRLGIDIVGVDMADTVGGLTDDGVSYPATSVFREEFPLWLGAPAELEEAEGGRILVKAGGNEKVVDKVLVALGRKPNLDGLNLAAAGIETGERGTPDFDPATQRIGETHFFIAGDADGHRQILHEAADDGRIAGFNAAALARGERVRRFRRKVPLAIVFSDPNIAMVGETFAQLDATLGEDEGFVVGERDFSTQARARVMLANRGVLHIYARKEDGRLLGAEMCIPRAEHIAHELAWAMERGLTVADLIAMPFYHPVVEEGLQNALHDAYAQLPDSAKVPGIPDVPFAD